MNMTHRPPRPQQEAPGPFCWCEYDNSQDHSSENDHCTPQLLIVCAPSPMLPIFPHYSIHLYNPTKKVLLLCCLSDEETEGQSSSVPVT